MHIIHIIPEFQDIRQIIEIKYLQNFNQIDTLEKFTFLSTNCFIK